jgi:hypothetical protein
MVAGRRVKRLRDLVAQIELLPVSPDRDRLLSEFRSRAVDVDTGETPRAILPLREPAPAPLLHRPPQDDRAPGMRRMRPPPAAPAVELACPAYAATRSKNLDDPFTVDERLSLEDSLRLPPLPHVRTRGNRAVPPWTLGLRG